MGRGTREGKGQMEGEEEFAPALDMSHHFGDVTKARKRSEVKATYHYFAIPGIGQLASGLPNEKYFPYDTLEASVALPDRFTTSSVNHHVRSERKLSNLSLYSPSTSSKKGSVADSCMLVPKASAEPDADRKIDITTALQYGVADGYPPLVAWVYQFTRENLHPLVPYKDGVEIVMSCGNTDGFSMAIQVMSNEWVPGKHPVNLRPGILVEEFVYMTPIQTVRPRGLNVVPVSIDEEGMNPFGKGGLEDVLENWDFSRGMRPHLIYTVTVGQNPTGGTLSLERRQVIYNLCHKYDVVIIEDDPYWFLQYPSVPSGAKGKELSLNAAKSKELSSNGVVEEAKVKRKSSGYEFLDSLLPSYLAVDTDGRVIRLDTFSKSVAPGCRLGWITAQPAIIERIICIVETSTQHPSGFVQSTIAEIIVGPSLKPSEENGRGGSLDGTGWCVDGWVRWLEGLRDAYQLRMQTMCTILEEGKFLVPSEDDVQSHGDWSIVEKTEMYSFRWPAGGMFVWLKVNFASHPLFSEYSTDDLSTALWIWMVDPYLVLLATGAMFSPTDEIAAERGWHYFRVCFAACSDEDVTSCSHRMVEAMQTFWKKETLDDILDLKLSGKHAVPKSLRDCVGPLGC